MKLTTKSLIEEWAHFVCKICGNRGSVEDLVRSAKFGTPWETVWGKVVCGLCIEQIESEFVSHDPASPDGDKTVTIKGRFLGDGKILVDEVVS